MGFFKESASTTSNKSIIRLQQLIWVLIYVRSRLTAGD